MKRFVMALAGAACLLEACHQTPTSGPPTLHLGRDECGECGMILNEERCASAVLIIEGDARAHKVFDDIGCMVEWTLDHKRTQVLGVFVHDYASRQWLEASKATFVREDDGKIKTPMGSGIIAFGAGADADAKAKEVGGRVLSWDGVLKAREAAGSK